MLQAETWRINHTPMSAKRKVASRSGTRKEPASDTASTTSSTSRLYVAPSASKSKGMRRIDSGTCAVDKSASARRRRTPSTTGSGFSPGGEIRAPNYYEHEDSSDSLVDNLEAPCLWSDDLETGSQDRLHRSFGSLNADNVRAMPSPRHKTRGMLSVSTHTAPNRTNSGSSKNRHHQRRRRYKSSRSDDSARSEYNDNDGDDASVYSYYTQRSGTGSVRAPLLADHPLPLEDQFSNIDTKGHSKRKAATSIWQVRKLQNLWRHTSLKWVLLQMVLISAFVWVVHDGKQRQVLHQQQLQEYEEERAHILEQMTWIDAAAKKVHQKFAGLDPASVLQQHETKTELMEEKKELLRELEQIQHRVQLNARHRTGTFFGDRPVQVSLPLLQEEGRHLVVALQDDAPHAVSTFLQQVNEKLWDEVDYQRLQHGRVLQIATRLSQTNPILEFAEQSRGCHQVGAVAVHQLESVDFHVLVLKIHMEEHAVMEDGDVCIGTVIAGLEELEQMIPAIPEIRSEKAAHEQFEAEEDLHEKIGATYGEPMMGSDEE